MRIETLIDLIYHNDENRTTIQAKHLARKYLVHRVRTEGISLVEQLRYKPKCYESDWRLLPILDGFGYATYGAILDVLYTLRENNINTGFRFRGWDEDNGI